MYRNGPKHIENAGTARKKPGHMLKKLGPDAGPLIWVKLGLEVGKFWRHAKENSGRTLRKFGQDAKKTRVGR
jgi:hypothetical protein